MAALQERFFARRERGDWFRAQPEEVRAAIGERVQWYDLPEEVRRG